MNQLAFYTAILAGLSWSTLLFASPTNAGDLIAGGWQYLIQRGGSTIYCGELATELLVKPVSPPLRLQVWLRAGSIQVLFPDTTLSLKIQSAGACSPGIDAQFYRLVLP